MPSEDPFVAQELVETLYHVLWELVHVFFEHRGLLEGREARPVTTPARRASSTRSWRESETDLDAVLADVRESVLMKSAEAEALREQTLREGPTSWPAAAAALRERFERGGKLLALGNGGSATDAMDVVADLREPPARLARARAPSTSPRTRRSSPRSPTTSAPRRSSSAR